MDAGYSYGLKIPPELCTECILLFRQCDEFAHPQKLLNFARIYHLEFVYICVHGSAAFDWDDLMVKLLTKGKSSLEPPLFELLDALAKRYEVEEQRCNDFKELKEKVRCALHERARTERDYRRLVEDIAPLSHGGGHVTAEQWVDAAGNDPDELALRITLAVFNGTSFDVIERAKDDLRESLRRLLPLPPAPNPADPPPPPPPHVPLMRRLKNARATESEGKPPDWKRAVELYEPALATEALWYVWQHYRESPWRETLIEWLSRYATGQPADVRMRAAVAVGRLAVKDYRYVRDKLLLRWVAATERDNRREVPAVYRSASASGEGGERDEADNRRSGQYRMAVGMALGVLIREKGMAAEVQSLLRSWAKSRQRAERWAAARAYIYVGSHCRPTSEVIRSWREVAAPELVAVDLQIAEHLFVRLKNPMYMSLVDAMLQFFASVAQQPPEERGALVDGILEGLTEWISAGKADGGLALFMFTALGRMMSSDAGRDDGAEGTPLLLQLIDEQTEPTGYRRRLARLFDLAMRNGATILEAQELLCAWMIWVNSLRDKAEPYESRVITLLRDIVAIDTSGRMRGRLRACLRDCGRNRVVEHVLARI